MLKVLWLCPYPHEQIQGSDDNPVHPAPWITELEKEICHKVELTVASCSNRLKQVIKLKKNSVGYIFCPSPRLRYDMLSLYRLRIRRLFDALKEIGPEFDVIHVHGTEHQYEIVARKLSRPYVVSMQGVMRYYRAYHPREFSAVYASWILNSIYEHTGVKHGTDFICRTRFDSGFVRELNPLARIHTNWELIRKEFTQGGCNEKSRNLLFLGGTSTFKGFREAMHCLNAVRSRGLDMRLRCCGHGNRAAVDRLIKKHRLNLRSRDIELLGYQSAQQIADLFKDSLCLIHPSYMDNSPNSICEAQVSGLPVIASDVGGVGSLITDGDTGMLVKRYDADGLADKVCRLAADPALYRSISERSRSLALQRHNREKIVNNTLEIYQNLAKSL